ncbi:hypothetical protein D1872_215870 [compost metagenome]
MRRSYFVNVQGYSDFLKLGFKQDRDIFIILGGGVYRQIKGKSVLIARFFHQRFSFFRAVFIFISLGGKIRRFAGNRAFQWRCLPEGNILDQLVLIDNIVDGLSYLQLIERLEIRVHAKIHDPVGRFRADRDVVFLRQALYVFCRDIERHIDLSFFKEHFAVRCFRYIFNDNFVNLRGAVPVVFVGYKYGFCGRIPFFKFKSSGTRGMLR